jgi:hypothetical protein
MEDMGESGMEGAESVLSETADGTADSEGGSESEALPDFSEEEPLDAALESFEEAMESAAAEAAEGGQEGGMPGAETGESGSPPGGGSGGAEEASTGGSAGSSGPMGEPPGGNSGDAGGGSGVLTNSEQVAILDGQLNRGTGDFDDLILRERGTIQGTTKSAPQGGDEEDPDGGGGGGGYNVPPMAASGSGQGGAGPIPRDAYDADIPQQTTAYPPPADIPAGTDDDVVARQLREAAMREPDPKLREKLWDEYRKYKGVD